MTKRPQKLRVALFFTRGVSLQTWEQVGMFDREVALYQRLQEHDVEVFFVTYGDAGDLRYADRIPGIRVLCNRWGLSRQRYERWLPLLHARHLWQADIYKTNQTNGGDLALRTARLFRKPLIARCGYMWSDYAARRYGADSDAARLAREQETLVFEGADRVVVTAGHMKEYAVEQYELEDRKVRVIPNYVLTDLFRPDPETLPQPGHICFVGRLESEKNLFSLLEAVRELDVELTIIGEGPQREALEAASREHDANARFLGNQPHAELPRHLNSAEVVVLPSLYEGHPKVLLEAMACGCPVIGTDVAGIREIIRHRENGYLCGTSPEEIRAAIQDVLCNEALRTRMGRNARDFAVRHFSLDRVEEIELALLKEVAELKADRRPLENACGAIAALLSLAVSSAMHRGRRLTKRILMFVLKLLSTHQLESLICRLVAERTGALSPEEALRFLFRLDAALYPLWGQQSVAYDGGIHTKHRHIRYHDFFVNRIHDGERVLDIGCGNGALSHDIAERAGGEIVGIDLSEVSIAEARERYAHQRAEYRVGDALKHLPEEPFDVVVMSNVLEHLPERPAFLRRVSEHACPCRFLFRVPVFERHWSVPLKCELGVEWRLDPTHKTEYTLESFAEEMAAAGLRIVHQEVRWGEIWAEAVPDGS